MCRLEIKFLSGMGASPEIAVYYPNVIGRAFPGSQQSCAILVEGRDDGRGEVMLKATEKLLKKGVRILSQKGYVNESTGTFSLLINCLLSNSSLDDLVIQLRKIKHVKNAQSISQKSQLFDGMLFPLLLMGSERAIALSPTVIFEAQEKISLGQGINALFEAGRIYGVEIVSTIKQKFAMQPDGKRNEDVNIPIGIIEENVIRYLKATGWGKLSWDHGTTLERVFIHDPPSPRNGNAGTSGNRLIEGVVSGVTEGLQGKRFSVVEDHYDSQRGVLTIGMVETSVAVRMEAQVKRPILNEATRLPNSDVKTIDLQENPQEKPEVLATPIIGGSKLHLTYTKKSARQEKAAAPPIQSPDAGFDSIDEQKKKLEDRTKELELLIREVEKRITKTKEGIAETDAASKALDKTASLATKYLTQVKETEKRGTEERHPVQLPQRRKQVELSEEEVFAHEDEI